MKPIKLKELLRTAKDPATQRIVIDEGLWFDAPLFEGVASFSLESTIYGTQFARFYNKKNAAYLADRQRELIHS